MDNYKRLTRSITNRRIAGVCGGVAEYLNIDPVVVRILFLAGALFGTMGFWLYLIIWIAAPEDQNMLNR